MAKGIMKQTRHLTVVPDTVANDGTAWYMDAKSDDPKISIESVSKPLGGGKALYPLFPPFTDVKADEIEGGEDVLISTEPTKNMSRRLLERTYRLPVLLLWPIQTAVQLRACDMEVS